MTGHLFSYDNQLYVFGGFPSIPFGAKPIPYLGWCNHDILLKLNNATDLWEPVSCEQTPGPSWHKWNARLASGKIVHKLHATHFCLNA